MFGLVSVAGSKLPSSTTEASSGGLACSVGEFSSVFDWVDETTLGDGTASGDGTALGDGVLAIDPYDVEVAVRTSTKSFVVGTPYITP